MKAEITPEVASAASTLEDDDWVLEEGFWCGTCGNEFESGQQVLSVYAPEFDIGSTRAVEDIHLRCYQGEEFRSD